MLLECKTSLRVSKGVVITHTNHSLLWHKRPAEPEGAEDAVVIVSVSKRRRRAIIWSDLLVITIIVAICALAKTFIIRGGNAITAEMMMHYHLRHESHLHE